MKQPQELTTKLLPKPSTRKDSTLISTSHNVSLKITVRQAV